MAANVSGQPRMSGGCLACCSYAVADLEGARRRHRAHVAAAGGLHRRLVWFRVGWLVDLFAPQEPHPRLDGSLGEDAAVGQQDLSTGQPASVVAGEVLVF